MNSRLLKRAAGNLKLKISIDTFQKHMDLDINGLVTEGGNSLIQYQNTPLTAKQKEFIDALSPAQKGMIDKLNGTSHLEISMDVKGHFSISLIDSKE